MMECAKFLSQLSAYLDGELEEGEKKLVEEHLASCKSCAARFKELKTTVSFLRKTEEVEIPVKFQRRISEAVRAEIKQSGKPSRPVYLRRFAWRSLAIATGFLGLVLALLISYQIGFNLPFGTQLTKHKIAEKQGLSKAIEERKDRSGLNLEYGREKRILLGESILPEVKIGERSYERKELMIFLHKKSVQKVTEKITVNEVPTIKDSVVKNMVSDAEKKAQEGESLRQALKIVLGQVTTLAIPSYAEKGKLVGEPAWFIVINKPRDKSELRLTDCSVYAVSIENFKILASYTNR
jgi:hypothetical protein